MLTVREVLEKGVDKVRDHGKTIKIMNSKDGWFNHYDDVITGFIINDKNIEIYRDKETKRCYNKDTEKEREEKNDE